MSTAKRKNKQTKNLFHSKIAEYCTQTASTGITIRLSSIVLHDFSPGNSWHILSILVDRLRIKTVDYSTKQKCY